MRLVLCALSFAPCGARCAAPNCTTPTAIDLPDAPCHVRLARQAWYIWSGHIRLAIRHPMRHQMFGADAAAMRCCDPRQEESAGRTKQPTRQPAHIDDLSTNCQHNNTANRHGKPTRRPTADRHGEQCVMSRRHTGGVICGVIVRHMLRHVWRLAYRTNGNRSKKPSLRNPAHDG